MLKKINRFRLRELYNFQFTIRFYQKILTKVCKKSKIIYAYNWNAHIWWMWRSWLTRQFVALETVGSSPIFHPINYILGCSQAVRHQTLTLACASSNLASPAKTITVLICSDFFIYYDRINDKF